MCVNDILANGGEPIFFLDYFSSSKIDSSQFLKIIKSIHIGCRESGCSLIGGETAEMPGLYKKNDFDLAGFAVGVVERRNLINKNNVKNGALIIGLNSNGFHSNGFSLVRKVLKKNKLSTRSKLPFSSNKNIGDELLTPTKIYVRDLLPLVKMNLISSMAHITGGGIFENLSRALPSGFTATLDTKSFKIPEIFLWIKKLSNIPLIEMLNTFNCGIGMILVINLNKERKVINFLKKKKIKFNIIGKVEKKIKKTSNVIIRNFGKWRLK